MLYFPLHFVMVITFVFTLVLHFKMPKLCIGIVYSVYTWYSYNNNTFIGNKLHRAIGTLYNRNNIYIYILYYLKHQLL